MKRIKKLLTMGIMLLCLSLSFIKSVSAAGNFTFTINSNNTANVGDNIVFTFQISNMSTVPSGVAGLQGEIHFDDTKLQYVSSSNLVSSKNWNFKLNALSSSSYKFVADDDDAGPNALKTTTDVFTLTFKAIAQGPATVSIVNGKGSDATSSFGTAMGTNPTKTVTIGSAGPSNNASLTAISIPGCTLAPTFSSATTTYNCTVSEATSSVNVSATPIAGATIISGTGTKSLATGNNPISIVVRAEDGTTTKTYTVNVTKATATASDGRLDTLSIPGVSLSPNFNADTKNYTGQIGSDVNNVVINCSSIDPLAECIYTGNTNLKPGENTVTVTVRDKNTHDVLSTYTIKLNKAVTLSSDATLDSLSVTGYTLSPSFDPNNSMYTISVKNNVNSVNVKYNTTDPDAKTTITGNTNLKPGINNVLVTVTAADGSQKIYTIVVIKADTTDSNPVANLSSDNYLKDIKVDNKLEPGFNKDISSYNLFVPYETTKLDINAIANNTKSKVEIIGGETLEAGKVNVVTIKVTSENGSVRIYTLNVTRASIPSNNKLLYLAVDGYQLDKKYDKNIKEYSITVPYNINNLNVTAIPEFENATIKITGDTNLKPGNNVILVEVTDDHGFINIYKINVTKEAQTGGMGVSNISSQTIILIALGIFGFLILLFLIIFVLIRRKGSEPTVINNNITDNSNRSDHRSDDDVVGDNNIASSAPITSRNIASTDNSISNDKEVIEDVEKNDSKPESNYEIKNIIDALDDDAIQTLKENKDLAGTQTEAVIESANGEKIRITRKYEKHAPEGSDKDEK